ncbi:MAG TPA: mandelate racemase/muconate lactonizing enzyme family protein [Roseiflexaceae bacterium]|nr:mandelate racemase/muconate lactonizing enzyme family protein [Roseiflexaceae bacterium]
MKLRITDIKAYPAWVGHRNQLLVKVETDQGLYGWGESGLSGRELAVVGAVNHFREFLIGRDAMQIGRIWQEVYRSQYFEGGRVLQAALSAIDIALYDVVAKSLNVPVYQLLGGKQRDAVPCFATTGGDTLEALIEKVQMLIGLGWQCIRVGSAAARSASRIDRRAVPQPGETDPEQFIFEPRESIGLTAEWLTRLREAIGPTPVLGIDYHHRLTVAEAASFCQRMPSGTLDFLEEPIRDETPEAYESLRTMTPVPFAIGEEFASKWQFLPYIERGITNYARIDVCNVGGLTESMKVAGWCEAHYIDMMPHNPLGPICTAATVHFGAAVPNFSWLEMRATPGEAWRGGNDEIFPSQLRLEGSAIPVPDAPGLGVDVDEDYVRAQSFKFWEAPHLRRRDGSVTNW